MAAARLAVALARVSGGDEWCGRVARGLSRWRILASREQTASIRTELNHQRVVQSTLHDQLEAAQVGRFSVLIVLSVTADCAPFQSLCGLLHWDVCVLLVSVPLCCVLLLCLSLIAL